MSDPKKTVHLKVNDTGPSPVLSLKNGDGTIPDLASSTQWMHITLANGTKVTKTDVAPVSPTTDGKVQVTWVAADWPAGGGSLYASPDELGGRDEVEDHKFEIEVLWTGGQRISYPNDREGYPLHIEADIADGT